MAHCCCGKTDYQLRERVKSRDRSWVVGGILIGLTQIDIENQQKF